MTHSKAPVDPRVAEAVAAVRARVDLAPSLGVVLGSGLGAFADSLAGTQKLAASDVPHLHPTTVEGHSGTLSFGSLGGASIACLAGRVHLYEGHPVADVVFGVRVLAGLGCRAVLLTNAAGGIRAGLTPGSFLLLRDHLNLTGQNPLVSPVHPFVDMSHAYDDDLARAARGAARDAGIPLQEGVYAGLLGPSYETPAEIRMLRTLGADAVGMSTVLEVIALRELGVRVGAISCITNLAAGLSDAVLDHGDVQRTAERTRVAFEKLLTRWVLLTGRVLEQKD
ncbi:MAG TPA: purine-nucleoside phosphorylase [Polyangiaceae bacterium]|jgi:purine-nucleoside phosphorylase|nr:purine-nucleoside phosphorylase [Polyangiaceae bacterium]